MFKILIADDEAVERRALCMKIIKNIQDVEICGEAENGEELLEAVERYQPDILIVDIEMPVLTGLEAIQRIRDEKLLKHGKILIYTAYGQFSYAQDALKAKVDDYILKPVTIKKLIETIQKCMDQLKQEREVMLQTVEMKETVEQMRSKVEADFINDIRNPDISADQIRLYQRVLSVYDRRGFVVSLLMQASGDKVMQAQVYKNMVKELQKIFREYRGILGERTHQEVYGYLPEPEEQALGKYSSIEMVNDIVKRAEEKEIVRLRAGIGGVADNYQELFASYRESAMALHERTRKEKVIHFDDIDEEGKHQNVFLLNAEKLVTLIKENQQEACISLIKLNFFKVRDKDIEKIKDYVLETIIQVVYLLGEVLKGEKKQYAIAELTVRIQTVRELKELQVWTFNLFEELMEAVRKGNREGWSDLAQDAVNYIHDNFQKEVSLDILAEKLGVNSYYLSHVFTNMTGENYSSYLSRYRIEKACELLEKYNYSTSELAQKTGFSSTSYFSKVFKKKTGYTIGEYRLLH